MRNQYFSKRFSLHMRKNHFVYLIVIIFINILIFAIVGQELQQLSRQIAATEAKNLYASMSTEEEDELKIKLPELKLADETKSVFAQNTAKAQEYLTKNKQTNNFALHISSIYFPEELNWSLNQNQNFAPASIYKVPLAMCVLKLVEQGKFTMETRVSYANFSYTLAEALELMIRKSDNEAMTALERSLGGYPMFEEMIHNELGVNVKRRAQQSTAADFAKVFSKLTGPEQYLSGDYNSILLDHLTNIVSYQQDRIVAGVNLLKSENAVVAHKIGNLDGIYQDAGVIFSPKGVYVLVILNKNQLTTEAAAGHVQQLTRILLNGLI